MPLVADQTTGQQYQIDKTHRGLEATVDETTKILLIIQDREPVMVYASALDLKADRWWYQPLVLGCRCSSEAEKLRPAARALYDHAVATEFIARIPFKYLA